MTSLPETSSFRNTTFNRILPIMSAPQPLPPQTSPSSVEYQDDHQAPRLENNHRRKPPEDPISLTEQYQQHGPMDIREPSHLAHGSHETAQLDGSSGDSGMGLNSSVESHEYSGQFMPVPVGGGVVGRSIPLDSLSGGSGDSSGAEGKAAEESSGGSRLTRKSTAEDWFNAFNRDVQGNQSYDNDSPYYMPSLHRKKHQQGVRHPRPPKSHHGGFPDRSAQQSYRGGQMQVLDSTEESNSDSFRSVIDDLTIKNQKLKKRLRKLEGLHGQHVTHSERLFELRVHDLPEDKKAELERILQTFTSSIENGRAARDAAQANEFASEVRSSAIDSGYASVSRSGNDSSAPSSGQGRDMRRDDSGKPWPSSNVTSEISKMKLVVRRLEQLFTGGVDGASADWRISQQQQNVSDLAKAEENEAKLLAGVEIDVEGTREASLMSPPSNPSIDSGSKESLLTTDKPKFEQRPTRPIDLDPSREQVAEHNIEYLTHMTESSSKGPGMGTGWVYLNLIINLAQLHTINVTPPFVKKAIATVSSKLELSSDGKMVRWRRDDLSGYGSAMTCSTGDEGGSEQSASPGGGKIGGSGSGSGPSGAGLKPVQSDGSDQRFHYKPIFARSQSFDDDSSSFATSSDTDPDAPRRSSSGESRGSSQRSGTGPIIFYKGAGFCTDLSSQPLREDEEWNPQAQAQYAYDRATTRPLGATSRSPPSPSTKDESPLFRDGSAIPPEDEVLEIDQDDASIIEFSPKFTATSPETSPPAPIEFEASGIGGVLPADNFAINCQTKHYLLPDHHGRLPVTRSRSLKTRLHKKILHRIPKASINAFHDQGNTTDSSASESSSGDSTTAEKSGQPVGRSSSIKRLLKHEIYSANTQNLPPSKLPPASYIFPSPSDESSSSNGETDDDAPRSSGSEGYFYQATMDAYVYRTSGEESVIADIFERSSSSAATAGDGSRCSSVFSGRERGAPSVEDPTYDNPLSMDSEQSSSVGSAEQRRQDQLLEVERPNLKRSRGSVISSASNHQTRKSARMMSSSLQNSSTGSTES